MWICSYLDRYANMTADKENKIFFRSRIKESVHKEFKKLCVDLDVTMESVVNDSIEEWVNDKKQSQKTEK